MQRRGSSSSSRRSLALQVVLAAICLVPLLAPGRAQAGGDPAAGKALSLACQTCHIPTNPSSSAPRLAGQREGYLLKQLRAFRAGDRKDDLMGAIAKQLSDDDIANLAAFWSKEAAGSDTEVPAATLPIRTSKLTIPRDFPKGYTLYHTELDEKEGSVARTYANSIAVAAARAGKPLPDGSMIFTVNYSAKLDAEKKVVREADGSPAVDKVTSYSGMGSKAGWGKDIPQLLRNDNWAYSLFTADGKPRTEVNQAVCLACHKPQAAASYVFSLQALKDKAQAKPGAAAASSGKVAK